MFNELAFTFQLNNFDTTGLDILFYGQEHCDAMTLSDKNDEALTTESLNEMEKQA